MNKKTLQPLNIKVGSTLTLDMVMEFYHDSMARMMDELWKKLHLVVQNNYILRLKVAELQGVDVSWVDEVGNIMPDPHLQAMEVSPHVENDGSGVQSPPQEDWPDGDEQFRYVSTPLSRNAWSE